jgi:hypothetical protein
VRCRVIAEAGPADVDLEPASRAGRKRSARTKLCDRDRSLTPSTDAFPPSIVRKRPSTSLSTGVAPRSAERL